MKAWLNLRYTLPERQGLYARGLRKLGYEVVHGVPYKPEGIFITWNRIGVAHSAAQRYEAEGLPVLVTENASWGKWFAGDRWYTIARNRHNTAGCFTVGGNERWDSLGVDLKPWRTSGETVILAQRGIGSPPTAMPYGWHRAQKGRLRLHPGRNKDAIPLEVDLANAGKVITWGSGAALVALAMGIPVESHMPNWIGEQDNTDEGRLAMFRRLAWAQWTLDEIEDGTAFARLLSV